MSEVLIRYYQDDDKNFILSSWLRSYRNSQFAKKIQPEIYYANHARVVEHMIQTCTILVACDPTAPYVTYGYICYQPELIHYIYVKYPFRKLKIATILLESSLLKPPYIITHLTKAINLDINVVYNPYGV